MMRTVIVCLAGLGTAAHGAENPGHSQLQPASVPPGARPGGELDQFSPGTRSPYGLRYPDFWRLPNEQSLIGDWLATVSSEVGYLGNGGSTGTASFLEYGDFDEGLTLQRLFLRARNEATGSYVIARITGVGREDQYLGLEVGRYGAFNVNAYADSVPHVFSTNARVLWDGAGTSNLTLPSSLTPGGSTAAEVQAAFDGIDNSRIALERDQYGLAIRVTPSRRLTLHARAETEKRSGARPFGGAFTYPFVGQVMETVEPLNYRTHDIGAGVQWSGEKQQVNVTLGSSFFQNKTTTLTWENPGLTSFLLFEPPVGRTALAPDNQAHNLKVDYGTSLPWWRGRLTTTASYSATRQDDALVAPTIGTGNVTFGPTTIDLGLWNTAAALSRASADAKFNHALLQSRLTLQPTSKVRLIASLRWRDEDNDTDYLALNPLTGQFGYIAMDGGVGALIPTLSGLFDPTLPGSRVRVRSIPFERDDLEARLEAQYRFDSKTKLSVGYARESSDYAFRERSSVDDDVFTVEAQRRGLLGGVLKVEAALRQRSGDDYVPNPYEAFYSSSLPQFMPLLPAGSPPNTLAQLRKYDLADKDQLMLRARWNIIISPSMDLSFGGTRDKEDFDADYGLRSAETNSLNAQLNYQLGPHHNLFFYFARTKHKRDIANINDAGSIGIDPNAGGPVYPVANAWSEQVDETNDSLGGGYRISLESGIDVDINYSYSRADSAFDYSFNSNAAFFAVPAEVGTGFPEHEFDHHLLSASLRIPIRNNVAVRLLYRFEREEIDDFHYLGLDSPVVGNDIFLAANPEDYSGSSYAVLLETTF